MTYADWVNLVGWFTPFFAKYFSLSMGLFVGVAAGIAFVKGWQGR